MGVPAEKATKAASNAANELEYVAGVLERDRNDIYGYGLAAVTRCEAALARIKTALSFYHDADGHLHVRMWGDEEGTPPATCEK